MHLTNKLSLLEIDNRRLEKAGEKLVRGYDEQKAIVGRSVKKSVKTVATRPIAMVMCISSANPK